MGIMERRYQNWGVALGHFEAAAALSTRGFCEPFYWIGITRINEGSDVGRGIEVSILAAWLGDPCRACMRRLLGGPLMSGSACKIIPWACCGSPPQRLLRAK
jgi:hypothetical protein